MLEPRIPPLTGVRIAALTGHLMNPNYRNLALWAIIAVLLIALFNLFQTPQQRGAIARNRLFGVPAASSSAGRVKSVTIAGDRITGTYTDNSTGFQTYSPGDSDAGVSGSRRRASRSTRGPRPTAPARIFCDAARPGCR